MDCIFCKIIKGEIPSKKVLENNKFLIVLLESDLDKVANNISDILFKEHFEYNKTKIRFTVSGAINTRTNYKSQDIMLKEIENILQNAKHNGRNRWTISGDMVDKNTFTNKK